MGKEDIIAFQHVHVRAVNFKLHPQKERKRWVTWGGCKHLEFMHICVWETFAWVDKILRWGIADVFRCIRLMTIMQWFSVYVNDCLYIRSHTRNSWLEMQNWSCNCAKHKKKMSNKYVHISASFSLSMIKSSSSFLLFCQPAWGSSTMNWRSSMMNCGQVWWRDTLIHRQRSFRRIFHRARAWTQGVQKRWSPRHLPLAAHLRPWNNTIHIPLESTITSEHWRLRKHQWISSLLHNSRLEYFCTRHTQIKLTILPIPLAARNVLSVTVQFSLSLYCLTVVLCLSRYKADTIQKAPPTLHTLQMSEPVTVAPVFTHTHTHTHTHTYIYTRTHTHIYVYTCIYTYIYMCKWTHMLYKLSSILKSSSHTTCWACHGYIYTYTYM